MIFRSAKTKPISIRLTVEVLDQYQKRADLEDVALSKVLANACVSWLEAEKQIELQHAPKFIDTDGRKWIKVDGEEVHLTDPYTYKPHAFTEFDRD